jgi:hypothetical protein
MPTTINKTPRIAADKVKNGSESSIVLHENVIVQKTYRMAETLKNVPLPGK